MEKPSNPELLNSLSGENSTLAALEREMSVLVRRSSRALWVDEKTAPEGLDRWTYALLIRLSDEGPLRVGEVARRFGIDKSTASRHLGRLEAEGWVEAVSDVRDGRSALLRLSVAGEERLRQVREARLRPLRRVFASWKDEEQLQLARLLARLNAELDRLDGR